MVIVLDRLVPFIHLLPAWVLFRVFVIAANRKNGRGFRLRREIGLSVLFLYALCVVSVTLFPLRLGYSDAYGVFEVNLIPLWHTTKLLLRPLWSGHWRAIVPFCVENMLGNLLLFFPLGLLLPMLWKKYEVLSKVLVLAFWLSAGIEVLQFVLDCMGSILRVCDVDDVLLNTAGAFLGFMAYRWHVRMDGEEIDPQITQMTQIGRKEQGRRDQIEEREEQELH